jgi:hypothetical protein
MLKGRVCDSIIGGTQNLISKYRAGDQAKCKMIIESAKFRA